MVLKSEDYRSPDVFRVLHRRDDSSSMRNYPNNIPPSDYTVTYYDLEHDGLPNKNPAYEQSSRVSISYESGKGPFGNYRIFS